MYEIFNPVLPLGERHPYVSGDEALAVRVLTVLGTRPGQLPWRPAFGCALHEVVGRSITGAVLGQARYAIETSLRRWLPDVTIEALRLRIVPIGAQPMSAPTVPLAESAVLSMGVQAALELELELSGPDGPAHLTTVLEP